MHGEARLLASCTLAGCRLLSGQAAYTDLAFDHDAAKLSLIVANDNVSQALAAELGYNLLVSCPGRNNQLLKRKQMG